MKIKLGSLLFLMLLVQCTLVANGWFAGRFLLWIALSIAAFIVVREFHWRGACLVAVLALSKAVSIPIPSLETLYQILLSTTFLLAGFSCFGSQPNKMRTLLNIYLIVSIPFLLIQMTGVSEVFMYWNSDLLHDEVNYSTEDIGQFRGINLSPTMFVPEQDLTYYMAQGRPSGLLPANNLLSVLIVLALYLNFYFRGSARLNIGDLAVNLASVLVMSKLVFASYLLLMSFSVLLRRKVELLLALKYAWLISIFLTLYSIFFPGLFSVNFSFNALSWSLGVRLIDILNSLGMKELGHVFWFADPQYGLSVGGAAKSSDDYTSGLAVLVSTGLAIPVSIVFLLFLYRYRVRLNRLRLPKDFANKRYFALIFLIVLCFIAVPVFFKSILFCYILGISLTPMMKRKHDFL